MLLLVSLISQLLTALLSGVAAHRVGSIIRSCIDCIAVAFAIMRCWRDAIVRSTTQFDLRLAFPYFD